MEDQKRIIKFRAWDKENGLMLTPDMREFVNRFKLFTNGAYAYTGEYAEDWLVLMQYTGLKDKNGKEIYEGDIVIVMGEKKRVIVWGNAEWTFEDLDKALYSEDGIPFPTEKWLEVVGNIYENPELIKSRYAKRKN